MRGDIVVTQKGVHVFAGGSAPHRDGDFVHYRSYQGLSREVVTKLSLIDRSVSRQGRSHGVRPTY